jgi:hypothetical protein
LTTLEDMVEYGNCGCWTEENCSYIIINNGFLELRTFMPGLKQSTKDRDV